MLWEIIFYLTASGRSPVEEIIDSLTSKEKAKVIWLFDLLVKHDAFLGEPYVKKVTDELWELRLLGKGRHRRFLFSFDEKVIVMLHALSKKSRRLSPKDINTALLRLKDYRQRREK